MTSPSADGTLADSLISWVRMDISLLDLNGLIMCMPSGSTSPVTLPNKVSTPTCPDCTLVTDANRKITTRNAEMPNPNSRRPGLLPTSTTLPQASEYIVIRFLSRLDSTMQPPVLALGSKARWVVSGVVPGLHC